MLRLGVLRQDAVFINSLLCYTGATDTVDYKQIAMKMSLLTFCELIAETLVTCLFRNSKRNNTGEIASTLRANQGSSSWLYHTNRSEVDIIK